MSRKDTSAMMTDKFTIQTAETIQSAASMAGMMEHQAVTPAHFLIAALENRENIIPAVASRLECSPFQLCLKKRQKSADRV
jgi:ATP-dependent Clp protease ATP-binding subunit ClpA